MEGTIMEAPGKHELVARAMRKRKDEYDAERRRVETLVTAWCDYRQALERMREAFAASGMKKAETLSVLGPDGTLGGSELALITRPPARNQKSSTADQSIAPPSSAGEGGANGWS